MTAASKILATALLTVATGIAYAQSPSATDPAKPAPAPSNTENQRTPIDKGAVTPSAPSLPSAQSSMPEKSAATPAPQVERSPSTAASGSMSTPSNDRVTRSDTTVVERPPRADRN